MRSRSDFRDALLFLCGVWFIADPASALEPGDVIATDSSQNAIFLVDPATGDRQIIMKTSSSGTVGSGPGINTPISAVLGPSGDLFVVDRFGTVYRVDPSSGDRTIISSATLGAGPTITAPTDLAVDASGDIFITDGGTSITSKPAALYRVDPLTGDRTVVSNRDTGVGPEFETFTFGGLSFDDQGDFLAVSRHTVFRIDKGTGDRTIITSPTLGAGPEPVSIADTAIDSSGQVHFSARILVNSTVNHVLMDMVEPSGDRSVVSGAGVGSGPQLVEFKGIDFTSDDLLIMGHERSIYAIDPLTGHRALLSNGSNSSGPVVGLGPDFWDVRYISIVPIPEPGALGLLALGGLALAGRRRR